MSLPHLHQLIVCTKMKECMNMNSRYFNATDTNTSCWFSNYREQTPNIHPVHCCRRETSASPERSNESAVSGSDWPQISENSQKSLHQTDSFPGFTAIIQPAVASWRLLLCQAVILLRRFYLNFLHFLSVLRKDPSSAAPPEFFLIWEKALRIKGLTCTDCNPFKANL